MPITYVNLHFVQRAGRVCKKGVCECNSIRDVESVILGALAGQFGITFTQLFYALLHLALRKYFTLPTP